MDRRTRLLPGGYGRSALVVGETIPVGVRAERHWIWCEDGRRLLDFNNNFASLIHGHSHPLLVGAAVKALAGGASFGISNREELAHAAALLERLPHADQVRYTNSGTEAVMAAIRLARAATGRSRILLFDGAYHGTADAVLPAMGKDALRGVPDGVAADVVPIPINDLDRLERELGGGEPPAALLVDLLPNRIGMTPVSSEFIGRARNLCNGRGTLLIMDEVISLRLGWSGLAGEFGIRPDLTVTGKLIGGGFPVGAVAGPEALMSELNPLTPRGLQHGGTFASNRVSMAAGHAALELLTKDEIERINALGDRLRKKLSRRGPNDEGWTVSGRGSLVRLVPPAGSAPSVYRDLWWAAFNRGVLITPSGLMTVATTMSEEIVLGAAEAMLDAIGDALFGQVEHLPAEPAAEVIG